MTRRNNPSGRCTTMTEAQLARDRAAFERAVARQEEKDRKRVLSQKTTQAHEVATGEANEMTTRTRDNPDLEIVEWDAEPVVGEHAGCMVWNNGTGSRVEGTYLGIINDPVDGDPVHMFRDGIMGITPQSLCGIPVGTRDGLTETRSISAWRRSIKRK